MNDLRHPAAKEVNLNEEKKKKKYLKEGAWLEGDFTEVDMKKYRLWERKPQIRVKPPVWQEAPKSIS